jgi:DNA polymerase-3 subunit epsilon/CBS domain-containing protein
MSLDEPDRGGLIEPVETPVRADRERTFSRIDSYPYRHRIRDIMRTPLQLVAADTPVRDALARLIGDGLSSLYVRPAGASEQPLRPNDVGIITERDLLRALDAHGGETLDQPVERFMSKPIATAPADAFVYRAIGRMNRMRIRHLGATDESGFVIGSLSARDLLRLRGRGGVARRRDRPGRQRAGARRRLGEAAERGFSADGGKGVGPQRRRGDFA